MGFGASVARRGGPDVRALATEIDDDVRDRDFGSSRTRSRRPLSSHRDRTGGWVEMMSSSAANDRSSSSIAVIGVSPCTRPVTSNPILAAQESVSCNRAPASASSRSMSDAT